MYNIKIKYIGGIKVDMKIYNNKNEIDTSNFRAWAEIDLSKLKHKVEVIRKLLHDDVDIIGVVKANAYGHGDIVVSKYLESIGVKHFAVAFIEEAIKLRKSGIKGEIIILGWTPCCRKDELIKYDLCQTLVSEEYAEELNKLPGVVKGYIKLNTGMNRLGEPKEHLDLIKKMFDLNNIQIEGIFSHLSRSDSNLEVDIEFTKQQISNFDFILNKLKEDGYNPKNIHLQNSYGIVTYRDLHYNLVRPGIILYGVPSDPLDDTLNHLPDNMKFEAPLSLRCKVAMVKEITQGESVGYGNNYTATEHVKVATITIGYADGLSRLISKKDMKVLVNGKFAKQIGNVCMDQMMIDVSGIDVCEGDIVTLIGQDGDNYLSVNQISLLSNTITNETLSVIGERVNRVYHL